MKLSNLFSDGAVLQRGMPVPVWGTTEPESVVKITCAGVSAYGASSSTGEFLVRLPELPVGGPYELVAETASGRDRAVVRDVMVGEVCWPRDNPIWSSPSLPLRSSTGSSARSGRIPPPCG